MSPFLELIKPLNVFSAYAIPAALWGIPLLWRYINRQPLTRRQMMHAAWTIVATGCWILFGNIAFDAYRQGTITQPTAIVSAVVVTAFVIGSMHLFDRRYPEQDNS
ncbi:MAG: hypothetical protein WDO17_05555 [Alphaproteobacteria bacterium]